MADSSLVGVRLDKALPTVLPGLTRSEAQRLIEEGQVSVDGQKVKPSHLLSAGERILVEASAALGEPSPLVPEAVPLDVLCEDDSLLVVNKPRGMAVHPGAGGSSGTLVNALLARGHPLSSIGGADRLGIVHRLDKLTTGLLVVAKNDEVHLALAQQLKEREIRKEYLALVVGRPREERGVINLPIGRHPRNRYRMDVVAEGGREALTEFAVRETFESFSLLELLLHTGRTHQIRVHLAHIGHPVVGDGDYGGRAAAKAIARQRGYHELFRLLEALHGQALHAWRLTFRHPVTQERITLEAPPPQDMTELCDYLRGQGVA